MIAAAGNSLVFLPVFRLFKNRYPCYAVPSANICIEGFPRSGNSFFVAVFQQWNPEAIISHHSHLASSAKYAANQDKPTVVLVREPAEAIASAMAWDGVDSRILPSVGLITYLSFYQSLDKFRQKILFLDFHEAVNKPDTCIEKINQRFGTNFRKIEFTEAEKTRLQHVLAQQDEIEKRSELNSSLPNERKGKLKMTIVPNITSHPLFSRVQALYDEYLDITLGGKDSGVD